MEQNSREWHKAHHQALHKALDELVADFMEHTGKFPSKTTIFELMYWSSEQAEDPTERK